MVIIDNGYDALLKSNFDLYKTTYFDLQKEVKTWYNEDLKLFDTRNKYSPRENENLVKKATGLISNFFYAYKVGDSFLLMDGYNRLLSDVGILNIDTPVYLKVLTSELSDSQLMSVMFSLNAWKLSKSGGDDSQFRVNNFLDRGFRLFLYKKFDIEIVERQRYHYDADILDEYFRNEYESCGYFNYNIDFLFILFKNERIVDDFKHILEINNYDDTVTPVLFKHYDKFFQGYIRFLNRRRLKGDMSEHRFETYLEVLKKDSKFFKKLQGMSWTDSTRKNIFSFFDRIEKNMV